jgi:uncharacterized membrane protein YeaQ/YmgE (transglycosylase-associated protein family)
VEKRDLLIMLVIGAISGWLASFVVGGGRWGILGFIVAGIIGGVVGGWMLDAAKIRMNLGHPMLNAVAQGAIGAIAVIIVARIIAG